MILWRWKPNIGRQQQIRILADPIEFHQPQCSNRVPEVYYDAEVRFTLNTIFWRQESNRSRQPQFRILTDHFEFHQAQCSDLMQFKTKHYSSFQAFAVLSPKMAKHDATKTQSSQKFLNRFL